MAMNYDCLTYRYGSRRNAVFARKGMVATCQPLAAQAGMEMLQKGGNAVDAAIATAAALTVVEPTSNGIGGDSFALVWMKDTMYGLNASGKSPELLTRESLLAKGITEIPKHGFIPVTVPGAPAAWAELSRRFGKLSLEEALAPAIRYAEEGYAVSPTVSYFWDRAFRIYSERLVGESFMPWFQTFALKGCAPKAGELWKSDDMARTLREIAQTGAESFYRGNLADRIDAFSKEHGGYIRKEDLAGFQCEWVEPLHTDYRGYDVWEIPPNGHGIVALMALNMLKGFEFTDRDCVKTLHRQIEAMKLAFADGKHHIADQRKMRLSNEELLSESYAHERRKLIMEEAGEPEPGTPDRGGTVYLATADEDGNMVSMIQSNYMGFGSGIVIPGTGIALQNRGHGFCMEMDMVNCLEPGKKPYHTIIPGFLSKDGRPVGPFGVMGGMMQPQGHLQVVMNTIDFDMNPQESLDAYRWQWTEGKKVIVEKEMPEELIEGLRSLGHEIEVAKESDTFGRGQIIWRGEDGSLCGGTEPRADGSITAR
jgi:gamma-glutamyltranspeptidase/glutathione hydrolase